MQSSVGLDKRAKPDRKSNESGNTAGLAMQLKPKENVCGRQCNTYFEGKAGGKNKCKVNLVFFRVKLK